MIWLKKKKKKEKEKVELYRKRFAEWDIRDDQSPKKKKKANAILQAKKKKCLIKRKEVSPPVPLSHSPLPPPSFFSHHAFSFAARECNKSYDVPSSPFLDIESLYQLLEEPTPPSLPNGQLLPWLMVKAVGQNPIQP